MHQNLDLKLLQVFDVLWAERNVSRTAQRVHRTQSAVSASLDRLRTVFEDPLFVWNGREMQPTPRAEALAPRIRQILNLIDETVAGRYDDPLGTRRDFTIATADYIDFLLGSRLMRCLEREAPEATVYFLAVKAYMARGVRARDTDMFIVPKGAMNTARLSYRALFVDRYVCVAARDNDRVYPGMPVEEFVAIPQATFTSTPGSLTSHETSHLAELGIRYANRILTPHYMALPAIVAESGAVAIMQERLARLLSPLVGVKLVPPPVDYPPLEINLYWDPYFDDDPFHRWLRETIADISAALPPLSADY